MEYLQSHLEECVCLCVGLLWELGVGGLGWAALLES